MGRYLAFGVIYEISVELWSSREFENEDNLQKTLRDSFDYDRELFDLTEEKRNCLLTIKDKVLKEELLPLLEDIYSFIYLKPKSDKEGYPAVLKKLRSTSHHEWLELTQTIGEMSFQSDYFVELSDITFEHYRLETIIRNHCLEPILKTKNCSVKSGNSDV